MRSSAVPSQQVQRYSKKKCIFFLLYLYLSPFPLVCNPFRFGPGLLAPPPDPGWGGVAVQYRRCSAVHACLDSSCFDFRLTVQLKPYPYTNKRPRPNPHMLLYRTVSKKKGKAKRYAPHATYYTLRTPCGRLTFDRDAPR